MARVFCIKRKFFKTSIIGLFTVFLICIIYGVLYITFHDYIRDPVFLEEDKCPACYGKSYCHIFHSGNITFDSVSKLRLSDYVNTKNIYFAKKNDGSHLVLKKLAFNSELDDIDQDFCLKTSRSKKCDLSKYIYLTEFVKRELYTKTYANLSDMVKCPSLRLLTKMFDLYKERKSPRDLSAEERIQFGYTLSLNPEPLLMQTFRPEEGWPFPKYHGACGRFIVVDYVGQTLNNYFNAPWEERVDFALQILRIAERLTNNKEGYNLYLTDVAYDNLAVDKDGKIIIIDLENIIVVDQAIIKQKRSKGWDEPFYSPFDQCSPSTSCLSFSYDDMCGRLTLDHNFYAVCRNLLSHYAADVLMSDGFLHGLPNDVQDKYHIYEMLEECARPSEEGGRLKVVPKLMAALQEIRRDYF